MTEPTKGPRPAQAPRGRITVTPRSHRDPDMLDIEEDSKQDGMHYRWVRCRGDENAASVAKHKRKGYSIVKKEEGGVRTVVEPDDRPDSVIAIGDMILMACPEAVFQKRVTERRQLTEARFASTVAVTKQMAKEKGIQILKDRDSDDD